MPALVAGIHVFLARLSAEKAWMAGTSPAMTPNDSRQKKRWSLPRHFALAMFRQQRHQSLAHDEAGPVRGHVHLYSALDIDHGVGVCRFQNIAILCDDRSVPVDQFLGRAIFFAIIAEQYL